MSHIKGKKWIPTAIVLALAAVVFVILFAVSHKGRIYQAQSTELARLTYEQAEVLNVSQSNLSVDRSLPDGIVTGTQTILIRILTGDFAGQTLEIKNYVTPFDSLPLEVGDKISIYQNTDEDGSLGAVYVYEYDRIPGVFVVLGLFLLVTVLVGGRTGLKSLLGLALTVVTVIWIFCPLLMKGAQPVPTALLLCVYVSVVSFVILGGVGKKTLCACLGTVAGMGLAALFGVAAQAITRITSYSMYSTDSLLDEFRNIQLQDIPLHISGLLTAGIVIASLGAVMDVAMSLSSAMAELKSVNPGLTRRELWRSGMNVGRDMVGTMTNTLILAFAGNSLVLILYLWSLELGFRQLLSSSFFSVELISAISASIGVVLTVPLTALIGSLVYGRKE